MSEELKNKLKAFAEGTLSQSEHQRMEEELEKAELYHQYLDEILGENTIPEPDYNKKIVKNGKRRARFSNVASTLGILLSLYVLASILTAVFFTVGSPNRLERYREALNVSVLATLPNTRLSSGGIRVHFPAGAEFDFDLEKPVGHEIIPQGRIHGNFFYFQANVLIDRPFSSNPLTIMHPDLNDADEWQDFSGFDRLHQLPEGTMGEMAISFTEFLSMKEVFTLFKDRDIDLRWMGIDSGNHSWAEVGIPHDGFWLDRDLELVERSYERRFGFSRVVGSLHTRFIAQPFQDIEFREEEFRQALEIMEKYPAISRNFLFSTPPSQILGYISENGIRIPGVIITGPTPELLALEGEEWINHAQLGDVTFLNWPQHFE